MSLTASERQALTWLLAVCGVGAGVRVIAHMQERHAATPGADAALRRQLVAVDSSQRAQQQKPRRSSRSRLRGPPSSVSGAGLSDRAESAPRLVARRDLPTLALVDVDVADSAALERLPRIGPSLAARIVADRVQHGPFGSVEVLQRVRGIGPKLSASLVAHVTFSGTPRPSAVQR